MTQEHDTTAKAACKGTPERIHKVSVKGMTKEEWLAERSKSIGGSQMGAIMGTSPWSSAYSVYCERKGLYPAFEGNLATETGTYLEEFVAKKFAEISGLTVNKTQFLYRNDECPYLHASPDRLIIGAKRRPVAGLECKTTSQFCQKRVRDTDFPEIYYAQCVQYMMVTELPVWYLAVLVGNREFHIYMLTTDNTLEKPEWVEGMVYVPQADRDALQAAAIEFWRCLETDTPPDPQGTEADSKAISKAFGDVVPGTADLWGRELLLEQYTDAKKRADEADKEARKIAQMIQMEMGGRETGECMGYKVKWRMQDGKVSFDHKACVAANPDMAIYVKKGEPFRKFEVRKV